MKKINVLENSMINKIAAGEVVERPFSVVKELLENSLDAGATSIIVEIKEGGKKYIRVTDNGHGISSDQLKTAFLRHATSKIMTIEDLETIGTLGFRGEALSSISSVSRVEITTKTEPQISGYKLAIHGNEVIEEKEVGSTTGTNLIVTDLFYNVPARSKFLKKSSVETSYITELINTYALGRPDIAFKFINNNNIILNTTGNNKLKDVIFMVYGKDVLKNLKEINYKSGHVKVTGHIANPIAISRVTKKYGTFFLNGRYIKSELMLSAILNGVADKLMTRKFPLFVINVEIDPREVDVNVHPTKLEVRFTDEDYIYDVILKSIVNTFKNDNTLKIKESDVNKFSDFSDGKAFKLEKTLTLDDYETKPERPFLIKDEVSSNKILRDYSSESDKKDKIDISELYKEEKNKQGMNKAPNIELKLLDIEDEIHVPVKTVKRRNIDFKYIGQLFESYSLIQKDEDVFLIDQHAGHEKVIYERIIKDFKSANIDSQQLLQPISITLNEMDREVVINNLELLNKLGFDIEEFGVDTFAVRGVPVIYNKPTGSELFIDVIEIIKNSNNKVTDLSDLNLELFALKACKSAVKANTKLDFLEVKALIGELISLDNPNTCPHGRPTMIKISKKEIEKMFKRIL